MAMGIGAGGLKPGSKNPDPGSRATTGGAVDKPFSIEAGQQVNRSVSAPTATPVDATQQSAPTAPLTKKTDIPKQPTINRPMSQQDVADLLIKFQKSPTPSNKQIISTIIQYGLEASLKNFDSIHQLLQGRTQINATESAVISQLKNLPSPKSVDIISQFLLSSSPSQMTTLSTVQQSLQRLSVLLQGSSLPFASSLSGLVSDMDSRFKKILEKIKENPLSLLKLNKSGLLGDLKTLSEFLGGVDQKFLSEENATLQGLKREIQRFKSSVSGFIESHLTAPILSKENSQNLVGSDSFIYLAIPNPLAENQSSIEILIKKDPRDPDKKINPNKTKLFLNFQTPDIGSLGIEVEISDRQLWYTFYSDSSQTKQTIFSTLPELKEKMKALDYDIIQIQTREKKLDIQKILLPTLNLDTISRVVAEV